MYCSQYISGLLPVDYPHIYYRCIELVEILLKPAKQNLIKPNFSLETRLGGTVAGIDEAGRGPLVGPVVAASVVLNPRKLPSGINDSKILSAKTREKLYYKIIAKGSVGVAAATVEEIDRLNILNATLLAMRRSFVNLSWNLGRKPDAALIDGNQEPYLPCNSKTVIRGDTKSLSIAAASIVAKVTRDNLMKILADEFPNYGWQANAGYATKQHQLALTILGITPYHRQSFRPIRAKTH